MKRKSSCWGNLAKGWPPTQEGTLLSGKAELLTQSDWQMSTQGKGPATPSKLEILKTFYFTVLSFIFYTLYLNWQLCFSFYPRWKALPAVRSGAPPAQQGFLCPAYPWPIHFSFAFTRSALMRTLSAHSLNADTWPLKNCALYIIFRIMCWLGTDCGWVRTEETDVCHSKVALERLFAFLDNPGPLPRVFNHENIHTDLPTG